MGGYDDKRPLCPLFPSQVARTAATRALAVSTPSPRLVRHRIPAPPRRVRPPGRVIAEQPDMRHSRYVRGVTHFTSALRTSRGAWSATVAVPPRSRTWWTRPGCARCAAPSRPIVDQPQGRPAHAATCCRRSPGPAAGRAAARPPSPAGRPGPPRASTCPLPQEREEQPVVLRVRLPRPLGQPREPRPAKEPGQHRAKPELRVNEDRMARAMSAASSRWSRSAHPASTGARRDGTGPSA